jgi:hypothetical protein
METHVVGDILSLPVTILETNTGEPQLTNIMCSKTCVRKLNLLLSSLIS